MDGMMVETGDTFAGKRQSEAWKFMRKRALLTWLKPECTEKMMVIEVCGVNQEGILSRSC